MLLLLVWVTYAFNAGAREVMNRLLPAIIEAFNLTPSMSGLLSSAGTVAAGLGALLITAWGERKGLAWNRRKSQVIVAAVYLLFTFFIGLPAVTSITMLFIFQIVRFMFAAPDESYAASAAAEWWPEEHQGFVINTHHTAYPWGSALVVLGASFILSSTGDWRIPFLVLPIIPIVFWVIYCLYANRNRFARNNEKMKQMGLTPHLTVEEVDAHHQAYLSGASKSDGGFMTTLRLLKNHNVLAGFLVYACLMIAYFGFGYWLTPFLTYQCGYDNSTAAAFSVVFTLTAGIGQIFWGAFSDKFGAKRTVQISCAWLAVTFCLLPFVQTGVPALVGVQLLMGFCMNAAFPVLYRIAGASVPRDKLSSAIACCTTAGVLGGLSPVILGVLIDLGGGFDAITGYWLCIVFMVAFLVLALIIITTPCHEVSGPKRGKDWALSSFESCGIEKAE